MSPTCETSSPHPLEDNPPEGKNNHAKRKGEQKLPAVLEKNIFSEEVSPHVKHGLHTQPPWKNRYPEPLLPIEERKEVPENIPPPSAERDDGKKKREEAVKQYLIFRLKNETKDNGRQWQEQPYLPPVLSQLLHGTPLKLMYNYIYYTTKN